VALRTKDINQQRLVISVIIHEMLVTDVRSKISFPNKCPPIKFTLNSVLLIHEVVEIL
jgi:hypothetical protein